MATYTCDGSVRGQCGRVHHTIADAVRCCDRDDSACKSGGGQGSYSDRRPKRIDALGNIAPLTDADHDAWDALRMEGDNCEGFETDAGDFAQGWPQ